MRSDAYEQEVEFDRLCDALTGKGSDDLVMRLHGAHTQIGGGAKQIHLNAVSELAGQYADYFYTEADFSTHRYWILACRLTGLLHESMDWGSTFEDITNVADETVARMVSSLTADRRVPLPKRQELLANRVGLAEPASQLVKLADLQHDCFHFLGLNTNRTSIATWGMIGDWLYEARLLMRSLGKITDVKAIEEQVAELHVKLSELDDKITTATQQPKRRKR